jgi:hypothetical protein
MKKKALTEKIKTFCPACLTEMKETKPGAWKCKCGLCLEQMNIFQLDKQQVKNHKRELFV